MWQSKTKCFYLPTIAHTGGEEILQTYLAPNKLSAIKKKRLNVFAKCAVAYT